MKVGNREKQYNSNSMMNKCLDTQSCVQHLRLSFSKYHYLKLSYSNNKILQADKSTHSALR